MKTGIIDLVNIIEETN